MKHAFTPACHAVAKKAKAYRTGFTLVELSIVLVILGLLVGGVLAGQNLIAAAELRKVITDIESYKTAVFTFKDKYIHLPGDLPNQSAFWPTECATGNVAACRGNGNGEIRMFTDSQNVNEDYLFFNNLSWAGITQEPVNYSWNVNGNAFIGTHAPYIFEQRAGLEIYAPGERVCASSVWWCSYPASGHSFLIGKNTSTTAHIAVIKPEEAWSIDKKLDDGNPISGQVHAEHSNTSVVADRNCKSGADYNFAFSERENGCLLRISAGF